MLFGRSANDDEVAGCYAGDAHAARARALPLHARARPGSDTKSEFDPAPKMHHEYFYLHRPNRDIKIDYGLLHQ